MFVTTSLRWIIDLGKRRRHSSLDITKLCYHCYPTLRRTHAMQFTSFVNTAIYNMTDNRVLNNRPPPINDEETYLTRWQRDTLSQLRFGHCKLFNSYNKRLKQTDSSSSPDCVMDPHDVPHLFNCIAHPTKMTPENLWNRSG